MIGTRRPATLVESGPPSSFPRDPGEWSPHDPLILFLLVLLPFLLWNIIDPRGMWEKLSSWQFRDPEANEPSDAAFDMQRLISLISLIVLVVSALGLFSVAHRGAGARSTPTSTRAAQVYPYAPSTANDGYAKTTVTPEPVDPFPSASTSPVGGGDPVTLFTPVLTDTTGGRGSESSQRIGVDAFYYPWLPDDHPSAFANADVIDSRVALSAVDPAQATTTAGGQAALGEGPAILVRMTRAVCAVTAVTVTGRGQMLRIEVTGIIDPARCGQTIEGAYVAVPLTDEQVAAARAYQAPAYHPLNSSESRYGGRSTSGGKYCPTVFLAYDRAGLSGTWISERTDRQLTRDVLLPWTSGR